MIVALYAVGMAMLVFLAVQVAVRWTSRNPCLVRCVVMREGDAQRSDTLVVLVHAWIRKAKSLQNIRVALSSEFSGAAFLVPEYRGGLLSNASPYSIAAALEDAIASAQRDYGFSRIILVGHSAGALLVRKAFVWASGDTSDRIGQPQATRQASKWAHCVKGIVLLAGTNRGWSLAERPRHMTVPRHIVLRATRLFGIAFGAARFVRALERGAPFVADLRLQWAAMARDGRSLPMTIQLLGDTDDIVDKLDNADIQVTRHSEVQIVAQTGHYDIIDTEDTERGRDRMHHIVAAVRRVSEGDNVPLGPSATQAVAPTDLFVLLHGIRDFGDWTVEMRQEIAKKNPGARILTPQYGYFPMLRFLLFRDRQEHVRWFVDVLTEEVARSDAGVRVHVVAHSNGSYIVAAALNGYSHTKFGRIVLLGSVVSSSFPWDLYRGRYERVCNVVGARDWVVGICSGLFEVFKLSDIGFAGFRGFRSTSVHGDEVRYVQAGHSSLLTSAAGRKAVVDYVCNGKQVRKSLAKDLMTSRPMAIIDVLARLSWIVWMVGLLLVCLLAWLSALTLEAFGLPCWVGWTVSVGVILLVLLTV
jgi:broad specificity phosphatase PhoE